METKLKIHLKKKNPFSSISVIRVILINLTQNFLMGEIPYNINYLFYITGFLLTAV